MRPPLPTTTPAATVIRRGAGRRPRPSSFLTSQPHPPSPPALLLLPWRRLASSSSSSSSDGSSNNGSGDKEKEKEKEGNEDGAASTNDAAHFNVVAAEARSDPRRRFQISTDGERRQKVPVFRDLTRNRESFRERTMEHDTFVTNLPRALQQYEEEQELARRQGYARNPLVRDQATLIIDKGDASNRRWLSGAPEGAGSSNWAEREAMAQKERLSGVEGTIVRRRAGLAGAGLAGDTGLPDEGLSVEEKIQLAMAQGDFDNLKGKGKPLERYTSSEGQYFEDRTSHRFMETLHRAGVKPVWVDRAGRIKQMHATLRRRVQAEWARLLLDQAPISSGSIPRSALPRLQEQWRGVLEGLRSLEEDLAFVNNEIDLYNLQVPSLSLQRVRLRLDYLLDHDHDSSATSSSSLPPFLKAAAATGDDGACRIDTTAAAAFLRAAERDGVMSGVTSLGSLRLEAEEDRARQHKAQQEKGRGRWSASSGSIWGGSASSASSSSSSSGGGSGGGGGLLGSIASWFTGGKK